MLLEKSTDSKDYYTVAFYNLENLFDIYNDPKTLDDDFTPEGKKKWTQKRYDLKIKKLTSVMLQIGADEAGYVPAIIGLGEVENEFVVKELTESKNLKPYNYGYVHFDSSDERGIEVAFLYRKSLFEVIETKSHTLLLIDENNTRDYTRDILYIKGRFKGEVVHFLVNHWPSRRTGSDTTGSKRLEAAVLSRKIIEEINNEAPDQRIIVMGDFNDGPYDESVKKLKSDDLFNPFESLKDKGIGSATHQGKWLLFDQIILSNNFKTTSLLKFNKASVFNKYFLTEYKGKRKGNPFRTYVGRKHKGGFSDHFPVYIVLESA